MGIFDFFGFGNRIDGQLYQNDEPRFVLEEFFNGTIKAWGIIQDRKGAVIKRFDADLVGSWDGDVGTLEEEFRYYDGMIQQRKWHITKHGDQHYQGRAEDIIGEAKGVGYGNAICWKYSMDVPVDDTHYRLCFDDWIWAMNDDVVINRSYMKKFGITFAELTVFMQKVG